MKKLWFILAAAGGALALALYKLSRFDAEPAPYEVTRSEGRFELRRYPSLTVARTPMHGDRDASFKRLFRFISGENERKEKIPITTPATGIEGSGTGSAKKQRSCGCSLQGPNARTIRASGRRGIASLAAD
jgi:hypothetical protein